MSAERYYNIAKSVKLHFENDSYDFHKYGGKNKNLDKSFKNFKHTRVFEILSNRFTEQDFILFCYYIYSSGEYVHDSTLWNLANSMNFSKWKTDIIDNMNLLVTTKIEEFLADIGKKFPDTLVKNNRISDFVSHFAVDCFDILVIFSIAIPNFLVYCRKNEDFYQEIVNNRIEKSHGFLREYVTPQVIITINNFLKNEA
jgi:hypothetical protein